jgi:hypothetical protein
MFSSQKQKMTLVHLAQHQARQRESVLHRLRVERAIRLTPGQHDIHRHLLQLTPCESSAKYLANIIKAIKSPERAMAMPIPVVDYRVVTLVSKGERPTIKLLEPTNIEGTKIVPRMTGIVPVSVTRKSRGKRTTTFKGNRLTVVKIGWIPSS